MIDDELEDDYDSDLSRPSLTTKDVMELFGVSRMTVQNWRNKGWLTAHKAEVGGSVRFTRVNVDALTAQFTNFKRIDK